MIYAIIEASGRQLWIEQGKFYDVDYINAKPGDLVSLHRILMVNNNGEIVVGSPCIKSMSVRAQVLKHVNGEKISVFKMKSKKNYKVKQGHRQKLTRLLIKEIR